MGTSLDEAILQGCFNDVMSNLRQSPDMMHLAFAKLDLLRSIAVGLDVVSVAEGINAELEKVFPVGAKVKAVDGTLRGFSGIVTGPVSTYCRVPVAFDIYGKDCGFTLGIEELQVVE